MTFKQREAAMAAANKQEDMAAYFRGRGDEISATRCEAKAAELRASLR